MYDLKISGGTVVDGTGTDRFIGDVAVTDGVDLDLVCGGAYTVTARLFDPTTGQPGPAATTVHIHTC